MKSQYLKAETESRRTGKNIADLPITLILANGSVHPAKGKFVFIDRAVDTKTGTLRVRAEFPNAEKLLRPGMFGRIKVDLGVRPDSILVPERAVAELQGKNFRVGHRRRQQGDPTRRQGGRDDRGERVDSGRVEGRANASWSRACKRCAKARRCSR